MRFETLDMAQLSAEQQILVDQIAGGPRGAIRGPFLALLHDPKLDYMCILLVRKP